MSNLVEYTTKSRRHTIRDVFIAYSFVPSAKQKGKYTSGEEFAQWMIYEGGEGGEESDLGSFHPASMFAKTFSISGDTLAKNHAVVIDGFLKRQKRFLVILKKKNGNEKVSFMQIAELLVQILWKPFVSLKKKLKLKKIM